MKKVLILFLFAPLIVIGQNIKGIVTSQKSGLPVEDVNILALHSNTSTLTNENGEFVLKLPSNVKEKDFITFTHVGFTTLKISIEDLKKVNYNVTLKEEIQNLSELTITANSRLKLKPKLAVTKLAPLKNPISAFGSCLKDGEIYIVGGNDSYESNALETLKAKNINSEDPRFVEKYLEELAAQYSSTSYKNDLLIYDIKKDSWVTSEVKFKKRAFNNLTYYDNKFYVFGGKRVSDNKKFEYLQDQIEVFDLNKQKITIDKTYPHQASNASSFSYKDNIIVMGGSIKTTQKGKKEFTNKTHLYNITSGYWYELANMPIAMEPSGTIIDNKIYLIGGSSDKPVLDIQSFDLITEHWQTEGEIFSDLKNPAVTSNNNTIYFFEEGKMYVYDTKSKQLKEYLVDLNLKSSAMYFFENKLYIIGGTTYINYARAATAKVYSIAIDEFETTQLNRIKVLSSGANFAKVTD